MGHPQESRLACGRPAPSGTDKEGHSLLRKNWKERLAAYLRDHEFKQSESRNRIIEVLLEDAKGEASAPSWHFSVQGLVKRVQAAYPKIGAATVYRNLSVLIGSGLIRESLTDDSGTKIYEIADSPTSSSSHKEDAHHDHIVCLDCGHIFEFHEEVIEAAQDKISKKMSFKPVEHRHVIYAHCSYKS